MHVLSAVFAWEAYEKGSEVHLQADPTKLELLHQSYKVKKDDFKDKQKETILERVRCRIFLFPPLKKFPCSLFGVLMGLCLISLQYGGEEHLDAPPRELLLAQTEEYVEYSRHGAVLKGQEKAVARSKYEEDVLINNHMVGLVIRQCCKCTSYGFCFMDVKRIFNLFSAVYLGILLERWLLGLQMLLLDGEAELLYRGSWQESNGECHMQFIPT